MCMVYRHGTKEDGMSIGLYRLPFARCGHIARRPAPYHRILRNARWCIDFAMPEWTPIIAARSGIITSQRFSVRRTWRTPSPEGRNSNFIIMTHDDGQTSFYAHLAHQSRMFPDNTRVSAGTIIARSGQTGYATYPHLHFGVFNERGTNTPIPWLHYEEVQSFLRVRSARH